MFEFYFFWNFSIIKLQQHVAKTFLYNINFVVKILFSFYSSVLFTISLFYFKVELPSNMLLNTFWAAKYFLTFILLKFHKIYTRNLIFVYNNVAATWCQNIFNRFILLVKFHKSYILDICKFILNYHVYNSPKLKYISRVILL